MKRQGSWLKWLAQSLLFICLYFLNIFVLLVVCSKEIILLTVVKSILEKGAAVQTLLGVSPLITDPPPTNSNAL